VTVKTDRRGGEILEGLRVLQVTSDPGIAYCGRLLMLHGADVSRIDAPNSSDTPNESASLGLYLENGKHLLKVDDPSVVALTPILNGYDVILTGPEDYSRAIWPEAPASAVSLSLTPFGRSGPYAGWVATEKTLSMMTGRILLGQQPGKPPRKLPGNQCEFVAGAASFIAVLAALLRREWTGAGSSIELGKIEIIASADNGLYSAYSYLGTVRRASDAKYITGYPARVYETLDDPVFVAPGFGNVDMLAVLIERPELLDHPLFTNPRERQDRSAEFDELIQPWLDSHHAAEIVEQAQSLRMPFAQLTPVNALADDEQVRRRGFLEAVRTADAVLQLPASPVRPASAPATAANGSPGAEAAQDRHGQGTGQAVPTQRRDGKPATAPSPALPLAGIRVVDLTRAYAGPIATAILGELGAEIIKIESITRIDMPTRGTNYAENEIGERGWERAGFYHSVNNGKLGITIDLSSEDGRKLLERLIAESDVLVENSSARVMPNLGLGIDRLHELNEQLVVIQMSAYGRTGPKKDWIGYAQGMEAASALMRCGGGDGEGYFSSICAYADWVLGLYGAAAAVAGLVARQRTGRGAAYDISGVEGVIAHIGDVMADSVLAGAPPPRTANASARSAPSDTYLAEDGRYVVVDVVTDSQWRNLAALLGLPEEYTEDLSSSRRRMASRTQIDAVLGAWIARHGADDAVEQLQAGGVPCGPVKEWDEILMDDHLRHREYFELIDYPEVGTRPHQRFMPGAWNGVRRPPRTPAPTLGQHNNVVFHDLLGLSSAEMANLEDSGVIGTDPVKLPRRLRDKPLDLAGLEAHGLLRIDPDYRARLAEFFRHPIGLPADSETESSGRGV
jgi:crotonobetainyl-CoA:carnitine CoA-transferase CaiB-like acyl-CoA transferase